MKLSEAMLLSIGIVRNNISWFHEMDGVPCGCAIVTGLYSVGQAELTNQYCERALHRVWPWTREKSDRRYSDIANEISLRHFNGESRESLAAWIATIEPAEPAEPHAAQGVEDKVEQEVVHGHR